MAELQISITEKTMEDDDKDMFLYGIIYVRGRAQAYWLYNCMYQYVKAHFWREHSKFIIELGIKDDKGRYRPITNATCVTRGTLTFDEYCKQIDNFIMKEVCNDKGALHNVDISHTEENIPGTDIYDRELKVPKKKGRPKLIPCPIRKVETNKAEGKIVKCTKK